MIKGLFAMVNKIVALFLFLFNPRKQAIEKNLKKLGIKAHKAKLAYHTYYNLFNAYILLFAYTLLRKRPVLEIINEEYLKEGRIFLGIHYGPWDVAMRLVNDKYPFVSVVGKKDLLNFFRARHHIKLLYSSQGFKEISKIARDKRVALMFDRTFFEKGTHVKIGMSKLRVSRAAIVLARRLKQDIFFIIPCGKLNMVKLRIEKIPYGSYGTMLERIRTLMEDVVVKNPEWWFNFFTEWAN